MYLMLEINVPKDNEKHPGLSEVLGVCPVLCRLVP